MFAALSLLFALILLNGALAFSELAVVGSRRARLRQLADEGSAGATRALQLSAEPTRFLSTVQVGITCLGILSGAIGEATVADPLREWLKQFSLLAPYAGPLSVGAMVLALTYVSLVVGELVPKRLALTRPEAFASTVARPMQLLSVAARPVVRLLTVSTDSVLRLMRVRTTAGPTVSPEEIKVLINQGTEEGVFEPSEQELVTNVLNLDERSVSAILTPRSEIVFLDLRGSLETNREKLDQHLHAILPLCDGGLDTVVGFLRATRVLAALVHGGPVDLKALAEPALFVPHTMSIMRLLEHFKQAHQPIALVVDEYGSVDGVVSLMDVVSAIVGELPGTAGDEPAVIARDAGGWLVDGTADIEAIQRAIGEEAAGLVDDADPPRFRTLSGLAMWTLGRLPRTGDAFTRDGFRIEVVDMDGHRVDRVLLTRGPVPGAEGH